ncbi:hypothetical protein QJS10_CPB18g00913 [Acorus calamus]|uniref:Uncharacterized protein n=1 Tax=Acorus calamus TaxID=4465 RepID=A0AAV9CKK8_ACOCL|nr:hypothetical protein QJS10_CPB18g00913 [Acorus calamus]
MEVALMEETPVAPQPPPTWRTNHEALLRESADRFLREFRAGTRDFSGLRSVTFRSMQSHPDPPLEVVWLHAAATFHGGLASEIALPDRVALVRDLFQLIVACSASSDASKCVSLLAPVLYELQRCLVEVQSPSKELSAKAERKSRREVDALMEGIVGYISICCCQGCEGGDAPISSVSCFGEVVRVWMAEDELVGGEGLVRFFPLVGDEIRDGFGGDGGFGFGYLAAVVIAEAVLMRASLRVWAERGVASGDFLKELRVWMVGSITGFRNRAFFEILLKMLLDSTLPVGALLSIEEEAFLRDVLYDAVILVDYSFLNPTTETEQSADCLKSLAITRSIVTHKAIQAARANGDLAKAISYTEAFSRSSLPGRFIKCITNQIGSDKLSQPNITTPQALLKFLMNLEDQGLSISDHFSKLHSKLALDDELKGHSEHPLYKPGKKEADDDLFYVDTKGGETEEAMENNQEMHVVDTAFLAAAQSMRSMENGGRKKRKENRRGTEESHAKFVRYSLHESPVKRDITRSVAEVMNSGSEVEDPPSDEDMEEAEL